VCARCLIDLSRCAHGQTIVVGSRPPEVHTCVCNCQPGLHPTISLSWLGRQLASPQGARRGQGRATAVPLACAHRVQTPRTALFVAAPSPTLPRSRCPGLAMSCRISQPPHTLPSVRVISWRCSLRGHQRLPRDSCWQSVVHLDGAPVLLEESHGHLEGREEGCA